MDIATAILLGLVQGLTEWLPVSSSGHLVIFEHLTGETPPVAFDRIARIESRTFPDVDYPTKNASILRTAAANRSGRTVGREPGSSSR